MESEIGPEIVYYMGQNPMEAVRISALSPASAAREIGKLETKISAHKEEPKKISQAPEPAKAIAPKGAVTSFSYEKADIESFMKKRNEEAPPGRRR
jgi:hypothetical protein